MTEVQVREQYEVQKEMFSAWGDAIKHSVIVALQSAEIDCETFLKVPPNPRVKDTESFIAKALYRNKRYKNPLEDITDKVGIRFVVLTLNDIKTVKDCIESIELWECSKDRDFDEEKERNPELFTYQSVHYIVRNRQSFSHNGQVILPGCPCEIQIRTVLQHGYAELSHDVQYKKLKDLPAYDKRKIARSMALIEASDELFKEVKVMLENRDAIFRDYINIAYSMLPQDRYNDGLNKLIFEEYRDLVNPDLLEDLPHFLEEHNYLLDKIAEMRDVNLLYAQPITLLMYYLIDKHEYVFPSKWPLYEGILDDFYSDMGKSIDH